MKKQLNIIKLTIIITTVFSFVVMVFALDAVDILQKKIKNPRRLCGH